MAKFTIDGNSIDNVTAVTVSWTAASNARGGRAGAPPPLRLVVQRKTADSAGATIAPFKSAIKDDVAIQCSLKLPDHNGNHRVTLDLKNAYVAGWLLDPQPDGGPAIEVLEIFAGRASLTAGGKPASYDLGDQFHISDE